jgi:NAD(P)-dependent dehydrogenase (short-subunit alcohol dehydrogenase family)
MARYLDIKGKKALISGGGSGIGLATAAKLAAEGAIPILADINGEALENALESLLKEGFEAHAFRVDVTAIEEVRRLADALEHAWLSPDILVNCAGLTLVAHVSATDHEDWERIIKVNLMGTIHMVETFLPAMLERGYGHIVNVGSIDGFIPIPGQSAYCASKFAITGLTEVLHFDLKHCGIGVTMVCPGYVNTPMAKAHPVKDLPIRFRGWKTVSRLLEIFSLPPRKVADHVVDAIERNRFLVIPGLPSRIFYHYRRLFPRLATSSGMSVAKIYGRLRIKAPERALQAC